MDKVLFKEKLLSLVTEEDEGLRMILLEEISNGFSEIEAGKETFKKKYDELQAKYIDTFTAGVAVEEVEEELETEELETEEEGSDITFEDIFTKEEK